MKKIITFTNITGIPEDYRPTPASELVPDWYKDMESYMGGKKEPNAQNESPGTAKKCMPIFDAITSGYIIYTYCDVFVSQRLEYGKVTGDKHPFFQTPGHNVISFHQKAQLPEHPNGAGHEIQYPKWNNVWSIKTEPGYSCLFIPPVHRETPFVAFPGVVDTDTYTTPVNFPFVLKDPKMEGLIPAGTPIVQVIPFKRESWQMAFGDEKDIKEHDDTKKKLKSLFFDSYKRQFRQLKEYR